MVLKQADLVVIHRAPHITIQKRRAVWSRDAQQFPKPISQLTYDHKAFGIHSRGQCLLKSLIIRRSACLPAPPDTLKLPATSSPRTVCTCLLLSSQICPSQRKAVGERRLSTPSSTPLVGRLWKAGPLERLPSELDRVCPGPSARAASRGEGHLGVFAEKFVEHVQSRWVTTRLFPSPRTSAMTRSMWNRKRQPPTEPRRASIRSKGAFSALSKGAGEQGQSPMSVLPVIPVEPSQLQSFFCW